MGGAQLRPLRQSRVRHAIPARRAEQDPAAARRLYTEAMDTLNADAPAIFLYTPSNAAAVSRRLEGVEIDPYSWVSGLPQWRVRLRSKPP